MASITLERLTKVFPGGTTAVDAVDLTIAHGERLVLVGPSGSGKSTVLRMIAGLEAPSSGRILIGDRDVTDVPPERRDLAMVFQTYALYPHKTVRQNLAFGLSMRRVPSGDIDRRVAEAARALGLDGLLDRRPAALSGGQRQRVALGRALVRDPRAFLFDEPLSNLDPRLRGDARAELLRLHARLGATMVYVTHDQEEAMTLGQRIAVLREGRLVQVASPMELYEHPIDTFVAGFIGSPPMNLIDGRVVPAGGRVAFERDGRVLVELDPSRVRTAGIDPGGGARGTLGIRPQDVVLTSVPAGVEVAPRAAVTGRVEVVEPLGHVQTVHVDLDGWRMTAVVPAGVDCHPDQLVGVVIASEKVHLFQDREDGADGGEDGVRS